MSRLLAIATLLLPLISQVIDLATAWDDKDFFKHCPPSQCSQHGPEIRFPFCLDSSNTSSCGCGSRSIRKLVCSGQDTILVHSVLGPHNVSAIDYKRSSMNIIPLVDPCPLLRQQLIISTISSSPQADVANDKETLRDDSIYFTRPAALVCCPREFTPGATDFIAGPVSCLSNATNFFYFVYNNADMYLLPWDCKVVPVSGGGGGRWIPLYKLQSKSQQWFKESAESILSFAEKTVYWYEYPCDKQCELSGGRCAFSLQRRESFWMPGPQVPQVPHEWIYEKVINGQELAHTLETTQEEKDKVRQLAIVALWCIQWNPRNRPSMTRVVNMLTGRLQNLQMPPKPFVSSENELPVVTM